MTMHYPFGIHGVQAMAKTVTWDASTSGHLWSRIPSCLGSAFEGGPCGTCSSLRSCSALSDVITRARNSELHLTPISNQYLTAEQRDARVRVHVERESLLRLMVFRGDMRVAKLMKRLDTYKRILLALSERKVPRVHALILAELNDGSSPCLLYTSPSPRDQRGSRMPSSA